MRRHLREEAIEQRRLAEEAYEATGERLLQISWLKAKFELEEASQPTDLSSVNPDDLTQRLDDHRRAFVRLRQARKAEVSAFAHHEGESQPTT